MGLSDYNRQMGNARIVPTTPFSFGAYLLSRTSNDLADEQILLSFVGGEKMLKLYQNDLVILTKWRGLAEREPSLLKCYEEVHDAWIGELKLTRTFEGIERQLQASIGGGYSPAGFSAGYGSYMQQMDQQQQQQDQRNSASRGKAAGGLLGGLFSRIKGNTGGDRGQQGA